MPSTISDFSFRIDRAGKTVLTTGGEHVRGVITMLFAKKPGKDEYESELGLDLVGRRFTTYVDRTRDTEYESMIVSQITKYTDLLPVNVVAIYLNQSLYVNMQVMYNGEIYTMELSAPNGTNMDQMKSMLVNTNMFNNQ